jgi:SAM-dependent methyltransferase
MSDAGDREFWNDSFQENPEEVNVVDRFLQEEIENLEPGSALDLGCGSGLNALRLAEGGWSVLGVDWAERAIELARQEAQKRYLDATFIVGDITEWQPPKQFDLVISTYALPGSEMSYRALKTALSALSPGGTLIIAEWDRSMSDVWLFGEDDLKSPEQIVALLPGLEIEVAEVRCIEDAFSSPDDPRGLAGPTANVAFVRARKPL